MELIPILSTIILIATISTFILAIGAYILYKVRERKGLASAPPPPSTIEAEVIAPLKQHEREIEPAPAPGYGEPAYESQASRQPIFMNFQPMPPSYPGPAYKTPAAREVKNSRFLKYTSEGYVPATEEKNPGALKWR
jgi:hypothetical protein